MTDVTLNRSEKITPESDKVDALERVLNGLEQGRFTTVSPSYLQDVNTAMTYCDEIVTANKNIVDKQAVPVVKSLLEKAASGAFNMAVAGAAEPASKPNAEALAAIKAYCTQLKAKPRLG